MKIPIASVGMPARPQAQAPVTEVQGAPLKTRGRVWKLGDDVAVRLNAMGHSADVPGRDFDYNRRWGVAPSLSLGLTGPTRVTLSYFHQHDHNLPDYGLPALKSKFYDLGATASVFPYDAI